MSSGAEAMNCQKTAANGTWSARSVRKGRSRRRSCAEGPRTAGTGTAGEEPLSPALPPPWRGEGERGPAVAVEDGFGDGDGDGDGFGFGDGDGDGDGHADADDVGTPGLVS